MGKTKAKPKARRKPKPAKRRQALVRLHFDIAPGKRMDDNDFGWLQDWLIGLFENNMHDGIEEDGFPPCLEKTVPIVTAIGIAVEP